MNTYNLGTILAGTPAAYELQIPIKEWRSHCDINGGTGSGKTNLLYSLMLQNPAFCFIDGEGDAARAIADAMPCLYFRARDYSHPFGINLLQNVHPDDRAELTADIVELFTDIWDLSEINAVILDNLYPSIRLLLDNSGSTLADFPTLLTDETLLARMLTKCRDPDTRKFWRDFQAKSAADKKFRQQQTASTLNKARAFTRSLGIRLILGQYANSINFREIIDTGQTVVFDLSGIGDGPKKLLGSIIIFQFWRAAYSRNDIPEDERNDYTVFVDEFADFCSRTMPAILAKSRKRHVSFVLAQQYLEQLDEDLQLAILKNCGTKIECARPGTAFVTSKHHHEKWITVAEQTLPTGHLDRNIAVTRSRFCRERRDVEYALDWYERVRWARRKKDKEEAMELG